MDSNQLSELDHFKEFVELVFWTTLMAVGAWLTIPVPGVPITLQTMFVIACGLRQGPKRGAASTGLYLAAGLIGLPVFAGGLAGPAIFKAPSAGFLLAFPLAAMISGLGRPASGMVKWPKGLSCGFLATGIIYSGGLLGLHLNADLSWSAAARALVLFMPGDCVKIILAVALVRFLEGRRTIRLVRNLDD